jgi:hypothetical protein
MKAKTSARKSGSKGKPAGKRRVKDLPALKGRDIQGGGKAKPRVHADTEMQSRSDIGQKLQLDLNG